jgi:hypothetical protein
VLPFRFHVGTASHLGRMILTDRGGENDQSKLKFTPPLFSHKIILDAYCDVFGRN